MKVEPLWFPVRVDRYGACILNTESRVQAEPRTQRCDGENQEHQSRVRATVTVLDLVNANSRDSCFLSRAGRADLHPSDRRLPSAQAELEGSCDLSRGSCHDRDAAFCTALRDASSNRQIDLTPIKRVIADALPMPELSEVPPHALYPDLSPHGTATACRLPAMITCAALYDGRIQAGLLLSDAIARELARSSEWGADHVGREIQEANIG